MQKDVGEERRWKPLGFALESGIFDSKPGKKREKFERLQVPLNQ
jgi:hypothetical protein